MKWLAVALLLVTQCVTAEPLALIHTGCNANLERLSCTAGKLDVPKPDDLVAICPEAERCWIDGVTLYMKKLKDTVPTDFLDGCDNPATARGALIPYPWTTQADPCGAWKIWPASTFGSGPAIVVTPNGADISWKAPTSNVDGTPITGVIKYEVFRGFIDVAGKQLILDDPAKPMVKVADTLEISVKLTRQPAGVRCYAVRAVVGSDASLLSNAACKTMTLPAPSDGSITAPTDGSIK